MENPQPSQPLFTIYTTTWCGHCMQAKRWLAANGFKPGIHFTEIDIEQSDEAAQEVMKLNGGNRTVPTFVFTDGSTMMEPTDADLEAKLGAMKPAQS